MLTEEEIKAKEAEFEAKNAEFEATKAMLAKAEEERENYRKGLLSREEELKSLKSKDEDNENIEWDENSKKFQTETLSKSELIAREAAEKAAKSALEASNEKEALEEFNSLHNITDEERIELMANLDFTKFGKDSKKGIIKALERALVVTRFDRGEIIDPKEIARRDAENKNREMNISHGSSQNSGRYEEQKGGVTENQKSMAQRAGVKVESLEKEDDSRFATINIV
jgi:hypothetical protein